ncbi:MAG: hypothetical protein AB8H79_18705 [Myxococcota bacterium]
MSLLILFALTSFGCNRVVLAPFRCNDVQTVTTIAADEDVGLGFTADSVASTLRSGRSLQVVYGDKAPPSGDSGATYVVTPSGPPFDVQLIDRTDIDAAPPGVCITGLLLRFSIRATLSFTLGDHSIQIPAQNVTIEAHGETDDRIMLYSLWSLPIADAPAELARQATLAAGGRHEVTQIDIRLRGRFNPHERMDYRNWQRSIVLIDAMEDPFDEDTAADFSGVLSGHWDSPEDTDN